MGDLLPDESEFVELIGSNIHAAVGRAFVGASNAAEGSRNDCDSLAEVKRVDNVIRCAWAAVDIVADFDRVTDLVAVLVHNFRDCAERFELAFVGFYGATGYLAVHTWEDCVKQAKRDIAALAVKCNAIEATATGAFEYDDKFFFIHI